MSEIWIMRIPLYLSGHPIGVPISKDKARKLWKCKDMEDAKFSLRILSEFATRPPPPMQPNPVHHFIAEI